MFRPRLAAASLSGAADAAWAHAAAPYVGCAFLGGIALDEDARAAARRMVADRDRSEFLPPDPVAFVAEQLAAVAPLALRPAINVRSATVDPIRKVAGVCREHDAVLEVNAHCRQEELCAAGCGQTLLRDTDRLCRYVAAASTAGAATSVKLRAEVPGVDLGETTRRLAAAGADAVHVDAMDSEDVVADVAAHDVFVIANNGVRDAATVAEYRDYGADAVSVGRPSDDPVVLGRVHDAVTEESWDVEAGIQRAP